MLNLEGTTFLWQALLALASGLLQAWSMASIYLI